MANPTQLPEADYLFQQVTAPAFFEKLAADAGVSPPDAATADSLARLGRLIAPAVDLFLRKAASAEAADASSALKQAADDVFEIAGLAEPPRWATSTPGQFLDVPGVKAAAESLAAKLGMAECAVPGIPATSPDPKVVDEEDDETNETKTPMTPGEAR